MSAIDDLFQQLKTDGQKAFMPFITAGDPDLEFTEQLLRELDARGCHMVELGIPYSDPIADGPVIQASYTRALNGGVRLDAIFDMVSRVGPDLKMPIVMMVSYAIIFRTGVDEFLKQAKSAGVAGAIVPDMLVDESEERAAKCKAAEFSLIQLVTPTTPTDRAEKIAKHTTGFVYYVSVTGITGERTELPADLVDNVAAMRTKTDLPICIGFGISKPEHANFLKPVADGLIVGSAIVRRIEKVGTGDRDAVISEVGEFASSMLNAIDS